MLKFVFSRFLQTVVTVWAVLTLTFFMVRLAPGDPFATDRGMSEEVRENLLKQHGYDKPLLHQYGILIGNLAKGKFEPSTKQPGYTVDEIIRQSFPTSLTLGLLSLGIALGVGLPAGVLAAVKQNSKLDYIPMALSMGGICLPTFVLGPILALVFAVNFGWFNSSGWNSPSDWVLPAATLGLYYAAYIARITRGGMLEVLNQDFVRTAHAKGVPPLKVVLKHSLRGGLIPVVSYLAPAVAGIISGSFVIENVFEIPGLGTHFINAAVNRDFPLIQATVVFFATILIVLNFFSDILQAWMNPRLRVTE